MSSVVTIVTAGSRSVTSGFPDSVVGVSVTTIGLASDSTVGVWDRVVAMVVVVIAGTVGRVGDVAEDGGADGLVTDVSYGGGQDRLELRQTTSASVTPKGSET